MSDDKLTAVKTAVGTGSVATIDNQANKNALVEQIKSIKEQLGQLSLRASTSQMVVDTFLVWGSKELPAPIPPGSLFECYGAAANDLLVIEEARKNMKNAMYELKADLKKLG